MIESVDNTRLLELLKEIRNEMRDHRTLLLESIDHGRTLERHIETRLLALTQGIRELRDDLEQVIKSELMGLIGDLDLDGARGR